MKIGITSDWHFCQYSSIVRKNGEKYSVRLEHLVNSINWAESLFTDMGCYAHICLGDAFDKSFLNAAEISALNDVKWGKFLHYFLVGNHEMSSSDLLTNSANLFDMLPNCQVISSPTMLFDNIFLLPYILERNRKPLSEYLSIYSTKPRLILSHNDIAGIQFGSFLSNTGFPVDEIESSCNLFLNGHLHNEGQFCKNGWNVGNLCGQNFGEDASMYRHCAWILDTDTGDICVYENPFALNFYKLDFATNPIVDLSKLKPYSVCTIKCVESNFETIKNIVESSENIIESRYVVEYEHGEESSQIDSLAVNHLEQFENYVKTHIGTSDSILEELQEVLK